MLRLIYLKLLAISESLGKARLDRIESKLDKALELLEEIRQDHQGPEQATDLNLSAGPAEEQT